MATLDFKPLSQADRNRAPVDYMVTTTHDFFDSHYLGDFHVGLLGNQPSSTAQDSTEHPYNKPRRGAIPEDDFQLCCIGYSSFSRNYIVYFPFRSHFPLSYLDLISFVATYIAQPISMRSVNFSERHTYTLLHFYLTYCLN